MNKNNYILISLLTISVSLLSACGATDGYSIPVSDDIETISDLNFINDLATINSLGIVSDTSSETYPATPLEGVEPIVPFSSSGVSSSNILSYDQHAGFDSDIEATVLTVSINDNSYPVTGFSLAGEIPSINIVNVQRTTGAAFCSGNEAMKIIQTTDYSTGVSELTGTAKGKEVSCETYYTPIDDTTVTDADVGDFLSNYGYGEGVVTTCPEDYLSDVIDVCPGNMITNYIITDDLDISHNISTQITIDF